MRITKIVLAAALVGMTGVAFADYSGSREDRMQRALDNYHQTHQSRSQHGTNRQGIGQRDAYTPGPAARAEISAKRGAHNAGQAIKHGAQKVGHAVGTGLHKTGQAIGNAGSKLKSKSTEQ